MSSLLLVLLVLWVASLVFFVGALRRAPLVTDAEEAAGLEALDADDALATVELERVSLGSTCALPRGYALRSERADLPIAV